MSITQNEAGLFEAYDNGCLIGGEAEQALEEQDVQDREFEQEISAGDIGDEEDFSIDPFPHDSDLEKTPEKSEFFLNNPGYQPCNCEDYPCCGH